MNVLIGTEHGLLALDPDPRVILEADVTALALYEGTVWVLADRTRLLRGNGAAFDHVATVEADPGTCLSAGPAGVFIGTARAHLLRLDGDTLRPVDGSEAAPGRDDWYTPWGGPADTRSITQDDEGTLYVNVHVGGVLRSTDGGATWEQTLDIDADIHQVLAARGRVFAPGAFALHESTDGAATWLERTDGFAATYMRAVAVGAEHVFVTASRSHAGGDAGLYRRPLGSDAAFERCDLPAALSKENIDTTWLDATPDAAVFATAEGDVWRSTDDGASWEHATSGIARPRAVLIT